MIGLVIAGRTLYYARPLAGIDTFDYHERWLLPDQGWSISRLRFLPAVRNPFDWYVETELMAVEGNIWRVRNGYLDVEVHEGRRYDLDDAEELAEGIAAGHLDLREAATVLESLGRLCEALRENGCSVAALLAQFAPDLPR